MEYITVFECVSLTVYSFTFLLGLPANLLVFFIYVRKARKRGATPNVVYAINLCMSNLVLVAWMPVKAAETVLNIWTLPGLLCPIYNFFLFASLYGSGLLLTAVAVGRYLSIAFPITYKLYRRARTSCLVSAFLWAIVLLHLGLALVAEEGAYFVSLYQHNMSKCYEKFSDEQLKVLVPLRLEMALLLFLLPLLISAFCTLRCLALVRRSCLPVGSKRRVLAMELSALFVFVVCYAPYNVSHVVGFVQNTNVSWRSEAIISSSCNVFLEPVVMLMLSPSTPMELMGRLCWKRAPQQHHKDIATVKDPMATAQGVASLVEKQIGSRSNKAVETKGASSVKAT
ncbi:free fatty acid receptor 3 [Pygocentrus nattereri]|uniref:free fatty acid receptor 3 n=1 Tax=Pygocentrus nattereri TaxID=42514 RepID=UPI000814A2EA|nr:free fatty acid receptor 3 [Pygocentrus nattereri]